MQYLCLLTPDCSYGSKRYTRCYDRLARTVDNCRGYGRYGDYYDRYDRYGGWDTEDRFKEKAREKSESHSTVMPDRKP